jgi:hypothetical protein
VSTESETFIWEVAITIVILYALLVIIGFIVVRVIRRPKDGDADADTCQSNRAVAMPFSQLEYCKHPGQEGYAFCSLCGSPLPVVEAKIECKHEGQESEFCTVCGKAVTDIREYERCNRCGRKGPKGVATQDRTCPCYGKWVNGIWVLGDRGYGPVPCEHLGQGDNIHCTACGQRLD